MMRGNYLNRGGKGLTVFKKVGELKISFQRLFDFSNICAEIYGDFFFNFNCFAVSHFVGSGTQNFGKCNHSDI